MTVSTAGTTGVTGEALVIFRSGVGKERGKQVLKAHGASLERYFGIISKHRGREMGLVRSRGKTTSQLLADLKKDPQVEHAEPNSIKYPLAARPNDPRFGELWGAEKIKAAEAWGLSRAVDPAVVVAVIDTGVSLQHPDLASVLWTNILEIPANGADDDHNGYVDDYFSYDFVYDRPDPAPVGAHGTHVAGTAAAAVDNAIGIAGIARGARIMGLKVADESENIPTSAIIEALQYVIAMRQRGVNIPVINASYGGDTFSSVEREAIRTAGDLGIILCAAAGNSSQDLDITPTYPASYRLGNMIVVAATDPNDALAGFSNYGAGSVDLAAPGVQILSAVVGLTGWVARASSVIAGIPMDYSGTAAGISGMIYDCGLGNVGEFPAAVRGNIALISRGTLTFADKVRNAMTAGAQAAIIYNNVAGQLLGTLGEPGSWIPTLGISQAEGLALKGLAPTIGQVSVSFAGDQYGLLSGTSMASPHVAGAVAFAAMQFPQDTVFQRIRRLLDTVDRVPSLVGKSITGGRLNLKTMTDADSDNLPDWWEVDGFGSLAGTPQDDPDQDGIPNDLEFAADTNPNDGQSVLQLTRIQPTGSGLELEWSGGTAARQYLQRAPTPAGPWVDVFTNPPPTQTQTAVRDGASSLGGFYRLRAERP